MNKSGSDPIGRWTWTTLGKANLHVVSAYRVGPGNDGLQTIRSMEIRRLLRRNHPLAKTPQKAFDQDIARYVESVKSKGHPILLFMDANSGYQQSDIKALERKTGLVNIIQHFHPDLEMPRTYDRGRECIDFVLGCEAALNLVKKCGYLEFYALTPDDHRPMFLDLDTDRLQLIAWHSRFHPRAVHPVSPKTVPSYQISRGVQMPSWCRWPSRQS